MIKIKGVLFPEVKKLGKYTLKETRKGTLEVYDENAECIIEFIDADIHTFNTLAELEAELEAQTLEDEYEDIFGNFGEYMCGQHDLGREGSVEDYLECFENMDKSFENMNKIFAETFGS